MAYLIDSNVFLRLVPADDPDRHTALRALAKLRAANEQLFYTSQVLAEFWTVSTRPVSARGGYGLSLARTERKARVIERFCRLVPDGLATHLEWRRLITAHSVIGVEVHDARLVAAMLVHGIPNLLTFNLDDFKRFKQISVVSPAEVI
jgi:predicted nucleic acid-binding protein